MSASKAMYKVGDVVTMDGGEGAPDENFRVIRVTNTGTAHVVSFEPVPKFVPGYYRRQGPYTWEKPQPAIWYNEDPATDPNVTSGKAPAYTYHRCEVKNVYEGRM